VLAASAPLRLVPGWGAAPALVALALAHGLVWRHLRRGLAEPLPSAQSAGAAGAAESTGSVGSGERTFTGGRHRPGGA